MTHVRTSPYYPQTGGKLERYHRTIKSQCIRPGTPLSVEDARRIVQDYVGHYNDARLHAAIGYVSPLDKLLGREREIFAERDRKLEQARLRRRRRRQEETCYTESAWTEDGAPLASTPSADPGPEARAAGGPVSSADSSLHLA